MSSYPIDKAPTQHRRVLGLGREVRRFGDPLVVTEETTAWEIYNHKATEIDRELIKDWNDSLNTLLILVSCKTRDT
jgi:hypothetical protein